MRGCIRWWVSPVLLITMGVTQAADSASNQSRRFVERPGTGGAQVTSRAAAPPSVRPNIPSQPLSELHASVREAREAGGQAMDPALRDINLPGLKQDDPSLRPLVIYTRNGVNTAVNLSSQLTNRIATPFRKPLLVGAPANETSLQILGSDIYYIPSGSNPIGVYIVNAANKDQVISLTIVPKQDLPGQNVLLKVEDLAVAENLVGDSGGGKDAPENPSDYTAFVRSIMTQATRGEIPGYSVVPLDAGTAKVGQLKVHPDIVFTGATLDVYRYRITNTSANTLNLSEPAFYREGVKAVSFFPRLALRPNESSYVFILASKSMGGL